MMAQQRHADPAMAWAMLQAGPEVLPPPHDPPRPASRMERLRYIRDTYPMSMFLSQTQKQVLVIGPLLAEFGHELFVAAMARHRARMYGNALVCTRRGREAIWTDFAKVLPHDMDCESSIVSPRNGLDVPQDRMEYWRQMLCGAPFPVCEYLPGMREHAEFIVYGTETRKYAGVTVFHARSRDHVHARNWPTSRWQALADGLRKKGLADRIVCIGSPSASSVVPECEDLRGLPLAEQMNVLRSAKWAIGPSSGPMHLASLCRCPHVVWCGGAHSERMNTASRYRNHWNPHGTPVLAVPYATWRPTASAVLTWADALAGQLP